MITLIAGTTIAFPVHVSRIHNRDIAIVDSRFKVMRQEPTSNPDIVYVTAILVGEPVHIATDESQQLTTPLEG